MQNLTSKSIKLATVALMLLLLMAGCSKDKNPIGPEPNPTASLNCGINGIQISPGNSTCQVTCSATANGGNAPYQYSWNFGDNHSSSGSSAIHSYNSDGDYQISMTVTDDSGESCSKDTVIQVRISSALTCSASADKTTGQAPLTVRFSCATSGGRSPYRYSWTFGNGSSSSVSAPSHTYSDTGSYTATVTVHDANGASAQSAITITATGSTNSFLSSISATPTSGEAPLPVAFSGSASGGRQPYSYKWQFGDGSTSTLQNPGHVYQNAGNYTASLTVTDASSKISNKTITITVTAPQAGLSCQASADKTSGQAPLTIQFSCAASGGSSPYEYAWTFGDGASSSLRSPSHAFSSAGTYTSRVIVRDATGATSQSSVTISVTPATSTLQCTVSATPTSGVAPLAVAFTANVTGGTTPYSYLWQFGDGSTSTLRNPSHTYQTSGSYSAKLTVTDGASNTCQETTAIAAYPPPAAPGLSGPSNVNAGLTYALTWSYNWPMLATNGEKVVLERSTSGPTSGFSQVAEIPRGGSSRFAILNPQAGTYYYRARVRVGVVGQLTWSSYSSVVKVIVTAPISKTRFNNTGTYFIVSLKVDGVEQFTTSPQGLPSGYYYEMDLAPGTHSYEALFGFWNEYDQRDYLYRTTGSYTQRSGVTEVVALPGPTINDLLTRFSSSGLWSAWIIGSTEKASYRFFANGTYNFYVGSELRASGTYRYISRNGVTWAVTFSDGTNQGVLYEYLGYFVMYNGPNGGALQYFHEGQ